MELHHTLHDGKYVIHPTGEIVFETAHRLRDFFGSLLEEKGYCFTLDLRDVTHIDSTGLGAILSLKALLEHQGRSFQIRNASAPVKHRLEVAGLVDVVHFH
ncbi:MAG TPA: STAS domain-containing protein [Spirochaetia bacterium]|nr:STAS domain-containing protein [Spirochaetia bacterium]